MLPRQHRLHRASEFGAVIRGGARKGRRTLVVHVRIESKSLVHSTSGPRFGLIVSKAVGDAVTRHRVSRRLRHICRPYVSELDPAVMVVIRALAPSSAASSEELAGDVDAALRSALAKAQIMAMGEGSSV